MLDPSTPGYTTAIDNHYEQSINNLLKMNYMRLQKQFSIQCGDYKQLTNVSDIVMNYCKHIANFNDIVQV